MQLFAGDRILSINDEDTRDMEHQDVIARLRAASSIELQVQRDTTPLPAALTSSPRSPSQLPESTQRNHEHHSVVDTAPILVSGLDELQGETTIDGDDNDDDDGYDNLGSIHGRPTTADGSSSSSRGGRGGGDNNARTVDIARGHTGLGLTIVTDEDLGVVRVSNLTPGGVAEATGRVFVGDQILAVNGSLTAGKEHEDVVDLLRERETVTLTLCTDTSPLPDLDDVDDDDDVEDVNEGVDEDVDEDEAAAIAMQQQQQQQQQQLLQRAGLRASTSNSRASSFYMQRQQREQAVANAEKRSVTLTKGELGFGMRVSSPSDNDVGACVTTIVEGGPAAVSGKVQENDVIVSINGVDVLDTEHDDIIELLKRNSTVDLVLSSDLSLLGLTLVPERRTVVLQRTEQGYGMKVTTDETLGIVRITAVTEDGPAYNSDLVFVGDVVLEVNGEALAGKTHEQVIQLLTQRDEAELVLLADDSPLPVADTDELEQDNGIKDIRVVHLKRDSTTGFGLRLAPADEAEFGALVVDIVSGGPAALNASVRLNDVLVEVDGMNVLDIEYVRACVRVGG